MRVLIALPQQQAETGNFVTARRLQNGLQALDIDVELLPIKLDESSAITTAINRFKPDRLLLLHAWRCGFPWLNCIEASAIPTTVLLTGTDINYDIMDKEKRPTVELVLKKAAAIISQNRLTYESILNQAADWADKLHYLAPGVSLGKKPYPLRRIHNIPKDAILFLHPAGIRPVKANLELLKLCDPLALSHKNFMIAFCGPPLDPIYFNAFQTAIKQRPWSRYLGIIPADAMPAAMSEADLILNHSRSEGISNALLEAVAIGRPVLARNIAGNAEILAQGKRKQLYDSDTEFIKLAQYFFHPNARKEGSSAYNLATQAQEAKNLNSLLKSLTIS
jgi:glycosyltransferase involved in cell wall biosynthesis